MFLERSGGFLWRNPNYLPNNLVLTKLVSLTFLSTNRCIFTSNLNRSLESPENPQSVHDFIVKDTYGHDIPLDIYKGKVLLIVNIASKCKLTNINYKQLTKLHEEYKDKDFKILSFPCNQFKSQAPEEDGEEMICHLALSSANLGHVFQKIEVNGRNEAQLYKFLKQKAGGSFGEAIKWNFTKFLVDKNGIPVERFAPITLPHFIVPKIKELLKE